MSRPLMVALVVLAAYALLNLVGSIVTAVVWRAGLLHRARPVAAVRARRIVALRAVPAVGSLFATLVLVAPAFVAFEPPGRRELAGPMLLILAAVGAALLIASVVIAIRTAIVSSRLERDWLGRATALTIDPPAGVPAYAIDTRAPIVALVGVFSPKLVAARSVIDTCSHAELANIVAHERGHLRARDNLKRWLMACAPDALRWTAIHQDMVTAWCDAAEDAADDAATGVTDRARLDLAALLVKIAGLGTPPPTAIAAISPFVEPDGLERRVRRLLSTDPTPVRSSATALLLMLAAGLLVATLAALSDPAALKATYELAEAVVALGR